MIKKIVVIFLIFMTASCAVSKPDNNKPIIDKDDLGVLGYMSITTGGDFDEPPMYPLGDQGITLDIKAELTYPKNRKYTDGKIKYSVLYEVKKTGEIGEIKILRGADEALNNEVIRVIKKLKPFYPAFKEGKPVSTFLSQIFYFSGV